MFSHAQCQPWDTEKSLKTTTSRVPRTPLVQRRRRAWRAPLSVHATPDKVLLNAMEKVLNQINGLVIKEVKKGKTGKAKIVSFSANSSGERAVEEPPSTLPGRNLPAYLALPLDEYSLLDPKWISRPDPDQPNTFLLKVSLQELMGVNLTPEVRIQVDVLEDRVLFTASEFALGGDPRFKEQFQLDLKSTLQHKPVEEQPKGGGLAANLLGKFGGAKKQGQGHQGHQQQQQQPQQPPQQEALHTETGPSDQVTIDVEASEASSSGEASMQQQQEQQQQQQQQQPRQQQQQADTSGADLSQGADPSPGPLLQDNAQVVVTPTVQTEGSRQYSHTEGSSHHAESRGRDGSAPDPRDSQHTGNGAAVLATLAADGSSSTNSSTNSSTSTSSSGPDDQPSTTPPQPAKLAGLLACEVKLRASLLLPHPLSVVPGPLLSLGASLVARATIRALLPAFLQLLSIDYGRWASGQPRSRTQGTGSLLQAPQQPIPEKDAGDEAGMERQATEGDAEGVKASKEGAGESSERGSNVNHESVGAGGVK